MCKCMRRAWRRNSRGRRGAAEFLAVDTAQSRETSRTAASTSKSADLFCGVHVAAATIAIAVRLSAAPGFCVSSIQLTFLSEYVNTILERRLVDLALLGPGPPLRISHQPPQVQPHQISPILKNLPKDSVIKRKEPKSADLSSKPCLCHTRRPARGQTTPSSWTTEPDGESDLS